MKKENAPYVFTGVWDCAQVASHVLTRLSQKMVSPVKTQTGVENPGFLTKSVTMPCCGPIWINMPEKSSACCVATCVAIGLTLMISSSFAADKKVDLSKIPAASTKAGLTYAAVIKPIFDHSCVKCHGAEKPKGKLRLDSREGALKGGEDGKVIVPGKATESQMLLGISHQGDPDLHMPPPNNKAKIPPLTPEEIGLIRAWIDQGAN